MRSLKGITLLAAVAALVSVAAAYAASPEAVQQAAPPVFAAGGDVGPAVYPSIVDTRLVRAQAAIGRATTDYDGNQPAASVNDIGAAVSNLTAAWSAEKYVIKTTPAPPPADDGLADALAVGGTYADPMTTAFGVFSAQHDLITNSVAMIETSNAALSARLISAITTMQNARLSAIKYIHTIAPPPPPVDDGLADGGAVGGSWGTVMPGLVTLLDDELQIIKGRLSMNSFPAAVKSALTDARLKAEDTEDLVNQYWPPLPADD